MLNGGTSYDQGERLNIILSGIKTAAQNIVNRLLNLETNVDVLNNNIYEVTYREIIDPTGTTTGSITFPTGATLDTDDYPGNAILSTLTPTGEVAGETPIFNNTPVTATLATNGNWVTNSFTTDPVAIIFRLKIKAIDYQNLDQGKIIEFNSAGELKDGSVTFPKLATDVITELNSKINSSKFEVIVNTLADLPTPDVNGAINLENNKTYRFRGLVNLGTNYIVPGNSNTLIGFDKSDDGFLYSGTGAAIRVINKTLSVERLIIVANGIGSKIFDINNTNIYSVQIGNCIFGGGNNGEMGIISGGSIVTFNLNLLSGSLIGRFVFTGNILDLAIDSNYFLNINSQHQIELSLLDSQSIKIANNIFRTAIGNTAVHVETTTIQNEGGGQVHDNGFSGAGERIVGIDADTTEWVLLNNTGELDTLLGYNPNSLYVLKDEFLVGSTESGEVGELGWSFTSGSIQIGTFSSEGRPGVIRRRANNVGTVTSFYTTRANNEPNFAYSNFVSCIHIIKPRLAVSTLTIRIGASQHWGTSNSPHAIYFEKLDTDTTWWCVCRNDTLQTRIDTGITVVEGDWYKLEMVKRENQVDFKINRTLVASIDTNIPDNSDLMQFGNHLIAAVTGNHEIEIDYFSAILRTINR